MRDPKHLAHGNFDFIGVDLLFDYNSYKLDLIEIVESYDLIKCAKISNTPTLILHCDDDRDIPVECSKESIKHFKKGKLIITKGLGHRRILRNKNIVKSVVNFLKN